MLMECTNGSLLPQSNGCLTTLFRCGIHHRRKCTTRSRIEYREREIERKRQKFRNRETLKCECGDVWRCVPNAKNIKIAANISRYILIWREPFRLSCCCCSMEPLSNYSVKVNQRKKLCNLLLWHKRESISFFFGPTKQIVLYNNVLKNIVKEHYNAHTHTLPVNMESNSLALFIFSFFLLLVMLAFGISFPRCVYSFALIIIAIIILMLGVIVSHPTQWRACVLVWLAFMCSSVA